SEICPFEPTTLTLVLVPRASMSNLRALSLALRSAAEPFKSVWVSLISCCTAARTHYSTNDHIPASGFVHSIATPCSVKAYGAARRSPPQLEVTICDFKFWNSPGLSWNMKSAGNRSRFLLTAFDPLGGNCGHRRRL